jgi:hypothetical protein
MLEPFSIRCYSAPKRRNQQKEVLVSSIRIIKTPSSILAPLYIREDWVGIEIPLVTDEELKANPLSGLRLGTGNEDGYLVFRHKAVDALREQGRLEAAGHWERNPLLGMYLQFKKEYCEIVP